MEINKCNHMMPSHSTSDFAKDIREFRRILGEAVYSRQDSLGKESSRLLKILSTKPESEDAESAGFDSKQGKRRERTGPGKDFGPVTRLTPQEVMEFRPERDKFLSAFLGDFADILTYLNDIYLVRCTLQYAIIRKEITDIDCDYFVVRPYRNDLLSPKEIARFLADEFNRAPVLTRNVLKSLSARHGDLSVLYAVCDDRKNKDGMAGRKEPETVIEEAILGLGERQIAFAKDITAYSIGLNNQELVGIDRYLAVSKRISKSSYSLKSFPLNYDVLDALRSDDIEMFYFTPEQRESLQRELKKTIEVLKGRGLFSLDEERAIYGKRVQDVVSQGGETGTLGTPTYASASADTGTESHQATINQVIFNIRTFIINQQNNNFGHRDSDDDNGVGLGQQQSQGQSPGAYQPNAAPNSSEAPSLPEPPQERKRKEQSIKSVVLPEDRMDRPLQYLGEESETAFQRLYRKMNGGYFNCSSLENFTGLFKCPADNTMESYTRIDWIHSSGIRGLLCFLEALYRPNDNVPSNLNRAIASRVFLVKGKEKNLGKNLLYCWGDGKTVDKRHPQEKRIQEFLELIKGTKNALSDT